MFRKVFYVWKKGRKKRENNDFKEIVLLKNLIEKYDIEDEEVKLSRICLEKTANV